MHYHIIITLYYICYKWFYKMSICNYRLNQLYVTPIIYAYEVYIYVYNL